MSDEPVRVNGRISVERHLTENESVIKEAVESIFPDVVWVEKYSVDGVDTLVGEFHSLDILRRRIAEQKIGDTAASVLSASIHHGRCRFYITKNAATAGRVNFSIDEGPLGDIKVEFTSADPEISMESIVNYITS